jgi:thiol-disulfide isomerase/thioredoxin
MKRRRSSKPLVPWKNTSNVQYNLNNYDSALYYQQSISGPDLSGDEGTERLALYAAKAKGAAFARELIEPQLIKGVNSPVMLEQLKLIYQQLNLPEIAFQKIREQNQVLANKKNKEEMMRKYGSEKAPAFTLKDLNGKPVSLLSLRGKVVVLDFWASWCGSCKQSTPIMQELVTRYKENENVVFLFVDCFERTDAKTTVVNTKQFIKEKQYDFNILFATDNIMPDAYNVSSIPTRFVIDKNGTITFADVSEGQLPAMIDAALEYR